LENVLYDAEKVFNSFVQAGYFAYLFGQSNTSKFRDLSDRLQDAENALTNTITRLNFGSQEELMRKMEEFYGSNSDQSDVRMNIGAVFDKLLEIDQRLSESGGLSSLQNAANREKICSALDTDPQSFSTEFERYFARVEEALKRIEDKGQENAAAMKEQMERIEASIANINANKSFSTGPIFPDFDIRQFNYDPSRCIGHKASALGTVCEG
jgi:methylphosphotriester-DNA--protein-cysteine methyltransferase